MVSKIYGGSIASIGGTGYSITGIGDMDDVVSVDLSREMIKAITDAGGNPKYTEYASIGHNSWDLAYGDPELMEWMLKQRKVAKTSR